MDETGPETERGEASLAAASPEDEHPPSKPTKAMKQAQRRKQRAESARTASLSRRSASVPPSLQPTAAASRSRRSASVPRNSEPATMTAVTTPVQGEVTATVETGDKAPADTGSAGSAAASAYTGIGGVRVLRSLFLKPLSLMFLMTVSMILQACQIQMRPLSHFSEPQSELVFWSLSRSGCAAARH